LELLNLRGRAVRKNGASIHDNRPDIGSIDHGFNSDIQSAVLFQHAEHCSDHTSRNLDFLSEMNFEVQIIIKENSKISDEVLPLDFLAIEI